MTKADSNRTGADGATIDAADQFGMLGDLCTLLSKSNAIAQLISVDPEAQPRWGCAAWAMVDLLAEAQQIADALHLAHGREASHA